VPPGRLTSFLLRIVDDRSCCSCRCVPQGRLTPFHFFLALLPSTPCASWPADFSLLLLAVSSRAGRVLLECTTNCRASCNDVASPLAWRVVVGLCSPASLFDFHVRDIKTNPPDPDADWQLETSVCCTVLQWALIR
jgi:hypothetical protein